MKFLYYFAVALLAFTTPGQAQSKDCSDPTRPGCALANNQASFIAEASEEDPLADTQCANDDPACLIKDLHESIAKIADFHWRDQVLREVAKALTEKGYPELALRIIEQVENQDTKAMTIRGIGVNTAKLSMPDDQKTYIYNQLKVAANNLSDAPSKDIAFRYIAKGQALAGFDAEADKTVDAVKDTSQRDKAYEEIAEVQAAQAKLDNVMETIARIESPSYRDRAYGAASKIFIKNGQIDPALKLAYKIETPYNRAQALLLVMKAETAQDQAAAESDEDKTKSDPTESQSDG